MLAGLLVLATLAQADYEGTEHRLKNAGVDAELRKRIHTAIDKAVRYLLKKQREDGSWAPQRTALMRPFHPPEAETVYATLALRHAGTPTAKRGARRGIAWLVPDKSLGRKNLYRHLYLAGPMNMLLMADRSHRDVALKITEAIEKGQDARTGWWGYRTFTKLGREDFTDANDGANLSTTQFAALGLWAGGRVRGRAHVGVWTKHLKSLVGTQSANGSWSYAALAKAKERMTYPCGTFMGTANLLLAIEGTGRAIQLDPKLAERVAAARKRALEALGRDAVAVLRAAQGLPTGSRGGTRGFRNYTLYALEKACLFAGVEEVGGVRWYLEGADLLCAEQQADGSWRRGLSPMVSTGDTISTCFALLFLLRSSQTYHPTTPRDVDLKKGPITGRSDKAKPPPSKQPPPPPPVPAEDAFDMLRKLRADLASKKAKGLPAPQRVLALGEVWNRVEEDAARWRGEATALLLDLIGGPPRRARDLAPRWDALQIAGAQVLTAVRPASAEMVWRKLNAGPLKAKSRDWLPSEAYWKSVLVELLPALGGDVSALRFLGEVMETREPYTERALAALQGIRAYKDLGPKTRYKLTRELIKRFEGMENATRSASSSTDSIVVRWRRYSFDVLATLRHLTRDARTRAFAKSKKGRQLVSIFDYRRWLARHKNLAAAPWSDR
jgi:hypothetical protein